MNTYKHFISLGRACYVAGSMSKLGVRDGSYPFDWLITDDFKMVLDYMDNSFEDFLNPENVECIEGYDHKFIDKKSGFVFLHDFEFSINEVGLLKQKYQNRIDKFIINTKEKTCFLRAITNQEEYEFVVENEEYIDEVIKKNNSENSIIFLLPTVVRKTKESKYQFFEIQEVDEGTEADKIRNWFDCNNELIKMCVSQYDAFQLWKNIQFDGKEQRKYMKLIQRRYMDLVAICQSAGMKKEYKAKRLIIYGAGNIGKELYRKIHKECEVICFIDKNLAGEIFDGIETKDIDCLREMSNPTIIVSAVYDYNQIYTDILEMCKTAIVLRYSDILN